MLSRNTIPLEAGCYYHVYNHANGNDNVFIHERNYIYFLEKYKFYLTPVADTFAYCLMPNHFHFLVKFKEETEIFEWMKRNEKIKENHTLTGLRADPFSNILSKRFSDFQNCYAKAINKQENRIGSLFAHPFKRKKITTQKQLIDTLLYIHNNPVNHGFVTVVENWEYSSFHTYLGKLPTFLLREEAISWFSDKENFIYCHKYFSGEPIETF